MRYNDVASLMGLGEKLKIALSSPREHGLTDLRAVALSSRSPIQEDGLTDFVARAALSSLNPMQEDGLTDFVARAVSLSSQDPMREDRLNGLVARNVADAGRLSRRTVVDLALRPALVPPRCVSHADMLGRELTDVVTLAGRPWMNCRRLPN